MSETSFWKTVARILGTLVAGTALLGISGFLPAPQQLTSFTTSCLLCIGVGYSVVAPG